MSRALRPWDVRGVLPPRRTRSPTARRPHPGRLPVAPGDPGPLATVLRSAALGSFPPPDGRVGVLPRPGGLADAVVALIAHHLVAADVDPEWVEAVLSPDDLGAPMRTAFLGLLGEELGRDPGELDVVLAAASMPIDERADPGQNERGPLVPVEQDFSHPRADRARRYRRDVRCFESSGGGLVTLGLGLAGRLEVSIEADPAARLAGLGTSLARAALGLVPAGTVVFAQVSPGNVASLRCFLRAGYRPIGAEVLFVG